MFVKARDHSFTALLVYVDDVILTGDDETEINHIKAALDAIFKIKDLGDLRFFLGLEVARSSKGIVVNQRKYALELISDAGLLSCRPLSTPMDCKTHLKHDDGPPFEDVSAYRRLVGRLLYLTTTRPDISFAFQQLSQYMSKPTITHHDAALRVLR